MAELIRYSEALLREEFRQHPRRHLLLRGRDRLRSDGRPQDARADPARHHDRRRPGDLRPLAAATRRRSGRSTRRASMAQSALVVATKAIFPHVPASEGIYNAIDVVNPEGLVTNAQFPRPISGAFATSYEVITAVHLRLLPPDAPRALDGLLREHDEHGRGRLRSARRATSATSSCTSGRRAATGPGRARRTTTPPSASTRRGRATSRSRCRSASTRSSRTATSSSPTRPGAGRHRGGMGVTRDFELTHGDATLSVLGSRGVEPGVGLGGRPARRSAAASIYDVGRARRVGDRRHALGRRRAARTRVIRFWEGGGGGWEDPAHAAGRVGARGRDRRLRQHRGGPRALRRRRPRRSTRTPRSTRSTRRRRRGSARRGTRPSAKRRAIPVRDRARRLERPRDPAQASTRAFARRYARARADGRRRRGGRRA